MQFSKEENSSINRILLSHSVIITDENIDDIMSSALDGGITYWCSKAEVVEDEYYGEYASDQISRGGSLRLYDYYDGEKYLLTKEKFLKGLQTAYEMGYANYDDWVDNERIETSEIDAIAADCIVQCAIWGDVVYG